MSNDNHEHVSMIFCTGVLGGVMATIWGFSAQYGGPTAFNTTDLATLVAGFGGAALGGGVSWLMAHQTSRESAERDRIARLELQRTKGLNLLLNYSMMVTDLHAMQNALNLYLANSQQSGLAGAPLWAQVGPIIGSMEFRLDPTDLSPLMDARQYALISTITETFMQHHALLQSTRLYAELRSEAEKIIGAAKDGGGGMLYASRTDELDDAIRPIASKMESLIRIIKARLEEWSPKSRDTLLAIGPALQKYFHDTTFPSFEADGSAPPDA